jgi:hypothetical protein
MLETETYAGKIMREKNKINTQSENKEVENENIIVIKYQKHKLVEKMLMDNKIIMMVPEDFSLMSAELTEAKYYKKKPDYIYTGKDKTAILIFSLEKGIINQDDIETIKDTIINLIKRLHPASKFDNNKVIKNETVMIGTFSYNLPVMDGELFNYIFLIPVSDGLIIGNLNCNDFTKREWLKAIDKIIPTIRENVEYKPESVIEKQRVVEKEQSKKIVQKGGFTDKNVKNRSWCIYE